MNRETFRAFLEGRNLSAEAIAEAIRVVEAFESFLSGLPHAPTLDSCSSEDVDAFSETLIAKSGNTYDTYLALLRYGAFARQRAMYIGCMELLDGAEAFGNLHARLGDELGESRRDRLFAGIEVPALGTPNRNKPILVQRVLERLASEDSAAGDRVLCRGLRDLKDEWFEDVRTEFAACRSVDEYLEKKRDRFLATLARHRDEGTWWFVQTITDEVIDFVRRNPEMCGGARVGDVIYVTKIPYLAHEWLNESDPQLRHYDYCHCPWVRESLRDGSARVPSAFCQCSSAFHKKPWEIALGQSLHADVLESILRGDDRCRFAIHLPSGVR